MPTEKKSQFSCPGVHEAADSARGARTKSPASENEVYGKSASVPTTSMRVVAMKSPVI